MEHPHSDQELFSLVSSTLFTAVLGDIMDQMGYTRQFFPPAITPLRDDMQLVGRALTVQLEPAGPQQRDYGQLFEALDDLKPGEVFVAGGAIGDAAVWGELMTTRALRLQSFGAVLDGPTRDTRRVLNMGFPVFCRGSYGQDQAGRATVTAYRVPLTMGGATVNNGDLIVADRDGVLAVPRVVESEVIERALQKATTENTLLDDLQRGMSAAEAFQKYGIF